LFAISCGQATSVQAPDGCFLTWDYRRTPRDGREAERRRVDKLFADFLSESGGRLAKCRACPTFFEKTDPRKIYCGERCASRVSSRSAKKDAHHRITHAKFGQVLEVLTKLSGQYSAAELLDDGFWKDAVVEATGSAAAAARKKKAQGLALSAIDRNRAHAVSVRWLSEHLINSEPCEKCAALIGKVSRVLGVDSFEGRA
jgi:hypothetical protein